MNQQNGKYLFAINNEWNSIEIFVDRRGVTLTVRRNLRDTETIHWTMLATWQRKHKIVIHRFWHQVNGRETPSAN